MGKLKMLMNQWEILQVQSACKYFYVQRNVLEMGVKSAVNNFNDGNRGILSFQLC